MTKQPAYVVRAITNEDSDEWSRLRTRLWPDTDDNHLASIDRFFAGLPCCIEQVLVVDDGQGNLLGFIELNIRPFAEGSEQNAVPYIEGWYVSDTCRRQGIGQALVEAAQQWAHSRGYNELASDTNVNNQASLQSHTALGFTEVERVVCFIKRW